MARRAFVVLFACLFAFPAAAQQSHRDKAHKAEAAKAESAASDPVVLRVNGVPYHRSLILAMRAKLPPQTQKLPFEQLYPHLIDQLITMSLVTDAAKKERLNDEPMVKQEMEFAANQVLADAYFSGIMKKEITQDKIRARFDQYVKAHPSREEVEARHILLPTEAEAKQVIAELNKGADFATLAREKTTDPAGKASGGDLGWFSREDMVPAFADAAFKLKKGQYTQTPVKTQFGWHVIKVEDRRTGKPPTYQELAPKLAQQMAQETARARVQQMAKTAKIQVFRPDGSPLPPPQAAAPKAAPAAGPTLAPFAGAPSGPPVPGVPTLAPATQNLGK